MAVILADVVGIAGIGREDYDTIATQADVAGTLVAGRIAVVGGPVE